MGFLTADEIVMSAATAMQERAALRDKVGGERSMQKTVEIFNTIRNRGLSEEDGWFFMIALKIARAQQGNFHADDYVDLAGYAGLAGECAGMDDE